MSYMNSPSQDKQIGRDAGDAVQLLPFRVRLVRTEAQLAKAVSMRASAYGRHVPELGERFREADALDHSRSTLIFLAESKEDGAPVGTLRIQTSSDGPLALERSFELPAAYTSRTRADVTRLAVREGTAGKQVKLVMFKALFRYCFATQIDWLLIGARPPLDKGYRAIGFEDVFEGGALVPLVTAGGLPHRILAFDVLTAERRWHEASHRLYRFMAHEYHPDIEVFAPLAVRESDQRRSDGFRGVGTPLELGIPLV